MREVVMNEKTNLLQLEEHFYQLVDVEEPNVFRNLFVVLPCCIHIVSRRISGLLIQHSVMVSSQEHHIPQNRL